MDVEFFKQTILNHSPRIHPWERECRKSKIFGQVFCGLMMGIENWAGWFLRALEQPSLFFEQHDSCSKTGLSSEYSEQAKGTQVLDKIRNVFNRKRFSLSVEAYLSLERDRIWLAIIQREGRGGYHINVLQTKS